jgi:hypothetical protein
MDPELKPYIKSCLENFSKIDSSIKSYVKNFPEPMATLVCRYKLAREYLEEELGGVIGYDSSRNYFESLEKILEPLFDYCAKLAVEKKLNSGGENQA